MTTVTNDNTTTTYSFLNTALSLLQRIPEQSYEQNIIDLQYYLMSRVADRNIDGIHWQPEANRWHAIF